VSAAPTLRQWLAAEPFALGMSSGFFSFFAHCGVMTVLEEEGLLPVRAAGSSAGALVAGAWAAGVEAPRLQRVLLGLRRRDFWDPGPGLGLLRGRLFLRRLEAMLPVQRFDACRIPLAASAFDLLARRTRVLRRGELAPALCASCAVPLMFQPVWIEGRPLWDGGVADRPGLAGIPRGTRLFYHHIASGWPWGGPGPPGLGFPPRPRMTALSLQGLTRVNPFALERGAAAFEEARRGMRRALELPLRGPVLSVDVA
jgi:NTE family protein